jgi:SAM-dependent methyltransferase
VVHALPTGPGETGGVSDQGFLHAAGPTPVAAFPADAELPVDVVVYGPDIPDESSLRLLGPTEGKRILVLGAGRGHTAVALASQGAHVIVVDAHDDRLEAARDLADANEVKLELHHGDLAELAFVRADTIDAALSVHELGRLDDLDRVLRQVNRILRTGSALVCSLPHPASLMLDDSEPGPPRVVRPYADRAARAVGDDRIHPRTIAEVFSSFGRANFRVDTVLEPPVQHDEPSPFWTETMTLVPATLVVRGRKDGV